MMSLPAKLVILLICFVAGLMAGVKWELGVQARAEVAAAGLRASDARRQRQAGEIAASSHAAALVTVNNQLGAAREKIATLSGRECFDARTVGLLNAIGDQPVRAAPIDAESAASAPAVGSGLRFSTEQDAAGAIATCRAAHSVLSSQVNQILDIEDKRHPPHASAPP